MDGPGVFVGRRRASTNRTWWANAIDGVRRVVVDRPARISDPPRQGDTPAREATMVVAHSGLRYDTDGRMSGDPAALGGLHVEINRYSGRPKGVQTPMGDRYNIGRPAAIAYGSQFELDGLNIEEAAYIPGATKAIT